MNPVCDCLFGSGPAVAFIHAARNVDYENDIAHGSLEPEQFFSELTLRCGFRYRKVQYMRGFVLLKFDLQQVFPTRAWDMQSGNLLLCSRRERPELEFSGENTA